MILHNIKIAKNKMLFFQKFILFFFLFFFFLAPYLSIPYLGNTGVLSLVIFSLFNIKRLSKSIFTNYFLVLLFFTLFFAFYVFFLGILHNNDSPLYVFKVLISIVSYILVGIILNRFSERYQFEKDHDSEFVILLLKISLLIISINSIIVLITQLDPTIKSIIESYLQKTSNIDYENHEYRSRGFASAGGASLSIFHALGIVISYSLAINKRISVILMIFSIIIIFSSLIFIGRSGIIFSIVGILFSTLINMKKITLKTTMIYFILGIVLFFLIRYLLNEFVPLNILEFTILNTLDLNKVQEDEGLNILVSEHFKIQSNPLTLFFGIGSYEEFNSQNMHSDSGYMRILYYLGIPLGISFFLGLIQILTFPIKNKIISRIYLPVFCLLLFANIKEPVLYVGFSARLVFIISGFFLASKYRQIRILPENKYQV